uniref:ARID domain-containing protein n=1 Tax=Glossina brevipalpis TaxID=37001 RepID=A0A1A9W235_9MUSC
MQQADDPPYLLVGTEVSAKYKGAFCEAKVSKVVRNIKVKVAYKQGLGSGIVSDDDIKAGPGQLRVGAVVEVRHPERKDYVEATITKIQDCSQYTVVFDDGDITTLRRTALCLKSGRHFNESETLDQLPLTHPEHFGNPVVGGRRGRRRGHMNDESSDDDDESDAKEVVNEKEEHIGKVVCVETESKKKDKEKWFPALVVAPTAQATVRIRVKDEYLVRSFKDGRYYTVPKKEATEFTREAAAKQDGPAVQAALEYLDNDILPPHWDRDSLFGLSNSSSENEDEIDSDSSDDEPREEKDRFVAQLYKYMDDRGTPLNKVPSIQNRDVDLYRLFRAVQKRGGYNRVTAQNQWKSIAIRLGFTSVTISITNLVKQAFKKFLQPYGEFHRKLGCSMLMSPRNSNRSKGRSLVRANSVASPKPADTNKETSASTSKLAANVSATANSTNTANVTSTVAAAPSEESENTSESSQDASKNKRKTSLSSSNLTTGKVKSIIEKYEEKASLKDDGDIPLSKIKGTGVSKEKDDPKEKDKESGGSKESSGQVTRDSSPTSAGTSIKKEKHQRKQSSQSDEKRGKRKKDEVIVEKIDTGDFIVETGDKLKVYYHEKKVTYEAKVIEIAVQRGTPMYLVHYTGWNNRYDEWVPRERIAENLTKCFKQKGRTANTGVSNEKSKENPPKPPTASSLTSSSGCVISNSGPTNSTTTPVTKGSGGATKRGRGRSDSMPPRSTTPSSVASNSSRTKSPATSTLKKRPQRQLPNTSRRVSTNVSDVSIPTEESESDSDEPVRRTARSGKNTGTLKSPGKSKASISAPNSQSDTDDNEDDGDVSTTGRNVTRKGRDYDLNQIRSELKGFQNLKTCSDPDITTADVKVENKDSSIVKIKSEKSDYDFKTLLAPGIVNTASGSFKEDPKLERKVEINKRSSTEISSESDSFNDDDSQSSDKTTQLENMTKKFQQIINADKQRTQDKPVTAPAITVVNKPIGPLSSSRIVEKIIKDRENEKRQESIKTKPSPLKEECKIFSTIASCKAENELKSGNVCVDLREDDKKHVLGSDVKASIIAPARFGNPGSSTVSKYTSVIVEKPLAVAKKPETVQDIKKTEATKKLIQTEIQSSKKFVEPSHHKDILKVEPPTACSPSSISSNSSVSSSNSSSSSTTSTSRSLPDMSKLDISGSSSMVSSCSSSTSSSSYSNAGKEQKFNSPPVDKPNSPDVYEFKDPEPFEFEIRKSPMVGASTSSVITSNMASSSSGNLVRNKLSSKTEHHSSFGSNPMSTLINRKKRGSPMKETISERTKHLKLDEKNTCGVSPLVADAKLLHHSSTGTGSMATSLIVKSNPNAGQIKPAVIASSIHAPTLTKTSTSALTSSANATSLLNPVIAQKSELTAFDALRKSPNFNLNINALNEELAQTVQETTRALTDAMQTPLTPTSLSNSEEAAPVIPSLSTTSTTSTMVFVTSLANAPSTSSAANPTPKLSTPTNNTTAKTTIGSPFIETRKDLSNIFELSFGASSNGRDNKFELENAKILLSATVGAFDLDPSKLETKPTPSIADKVLKAISQKKEEEENRKQEAASKEKELEIKEKELPPILGSVISGMLNPTLKSPLEAIPGPSNLSTSSSLLSEPLKINTELSSSSTSLLSGSLSNFLTSKRISPSLSSPEPKIGLLETIASKNQLSETIQKLECAIQRRTPVTSHPVTPTTPLSAAAAETYSDDSNDSTDSERRLVIEDVADESAPTQSDQKSSPVEIRPDSSKSTTPVKLDTSVESTTSSNHTQMDIPTPTPIKVLTSAEGRVNSGTTNANCSNTITTSMSSSLVSKLPGSTTVVTYQTPSKAIAASAILTSTASPAAQKPAIIIPTGIQQLCTTRGERISGINSANFTQNNTTTGTGSKTSGTTSSLTATTAGVPIELPDIPASVVVASSAVPSVMAAAQAAAAALQIPKPTSQKHLQHLSAQPLQQAMQTNFNKSGVQAIQQSLGTQGNATNPTFMTVAKSLENTATMRSTSTSAKQIGTTGHLQSAAKSLFHSSSPTVSFMSGPSSTSGFYLDPRTELRPDDGLKPLSDIQQRYDKEKLSVITSVSTPSTTTIAAQIKEIHTVSPALESCSNITDTHNDSINQLLCEETIPGSPVSVITGREDSQERTATGIMQEIISGDKEFPNINTSTQIASTVATVTASSSPNDSASQDDESSEDVKKSMDIENEVSPRKRRRTRKQGETVSVAGNEPQQQQQQTKRRRPIASNTKKNADNVSQRSSTTHSARQQHLPQHQQQGASGSRPCPYNFLVQLGDLASIDRRRKKLRRREREKKQQQMQNQQQMKIGS